MIEIENVLAFIGKLGINFEGILLTGSYCDNTSNEFSDVDIIILTYHIDQICVETFFDKTIEYQLS